MDKTIEEFSKNSLFFNHRRNVMFCKGLTLLMSTGLTFGTIASLFGLQTGIITPTQYSILVGVVVASAIIPTFIAQKWFLPVEEEDILEDDIFDLYSGR